MLRHWAEQELSEDYLRDAYRILWGARTIDEASDAVRILMASSETAAICTVFDALSYSFCEGGWEDQKIFQPLESALLGLAREQLASPPRSATSPSGDQIPEANHASAMSVLWRCGVWEDLRYILSVLLTSSNNFLVAPAALACLAIPYRSAGSLPEEFVEALVRVARCSIFWEDTRASAIKALATCGKHGLFVIAALAPEVGYPISIYAALALANSGDAYFRERAVALTQEWPVPAEYPGGEVKQLLGLPRHPEE